MKHKKRDTSESPILIILFLLLSFVCRKVTLSMVVRDQSIVIIKHGMQTELIFRLQKYFPISKKEILKIQGQQFCVRNF